MCLRLMRVWKCQIKKELTAPKNATRQEGIHRRAFFHRVIVISKLPREASDFSVGDRSTRQGEPHMCLSCEVSSECKFNSCGWPFVATTTTTTTTIIIIIILLLLKRDKQGYNVIDR